MMSFEGLLLILEKVWKIFCNTRVLYLFIYYFFELFTSLWSALKFKRFSTKRTLTINSLIDKFFIEQNKANSLILFLSHYGFITTEYRVRGFFSDHKPIRGGRKPLRYGTSLQYIGVSPAAAPTRRSHVCFIQSDDTSEGFACFNDLLRNNN